MSRIGVVIDTNVLISAMLKSSGPPALVFELVAFRAIEMFVSEAILAEYREVPGRPKSSDLDVKNVSRLLALIEAEGTLVTPTKKLAISAHDSDNRFYECADAAGASYLVTGNRRYFPTPYKSTTIITSRQLLDLVTGGQI
jgi:putative PIN family toxin of toxin-antitoxin system